MPRTMILSIEKYLRKVKDMYTEENTLCFSIIATRRKDYWLPPRWFKAQQQSRPLPGYYKAYQDLSWDPGSENIRTLVNVPRYD